MGPFVQRAGEGRDRVLDGMRAIAVLAVILGHALLFRYSVPSLSRVAGSAAVTGVEIFFLISGYVITLLLLKERDRNGFVDLRAFYVRRVTRIIPPFYVYLATISLLSLIGYIPVDGVTNAGAFLCNTNLPCPWFVGHSWSLAVEEQFYLLWPTVFILLRKPVPFLISVAVGLFVFSLARGFVPFANNMSFLYIAIGALVACSSRIQSWVIANVRTWQWFGLAFALLVGILFVPDRLMLVGKPVLLALLVFGAANVPVARWMLERPILQFIGKISYSLYLWQELFLGRDSHAPIILLPLVAYLSWRFIEYPCIALGRAFTKRSALLAVKPVARQNPVWHFGKQ